MILGGGFDPRAVWRLVDVPLNGPFRTHTMSSVFFDVRRPHGQVEYASLDGGLALVLDDALEDYLRALKWLVESPSSP